METALASSGRRCDRRQAVLKATRKSVHPQHTRNQSTCTCTDQKAHPVLKTTGPCVSRSVAAIRISCAQRDAARRGGGGVWPVRPTRTDQETTTLRSSEMKKQLFTAVIGAACGRRCLSSAASAASAAGAASAGAAGKGSALFKEWEEIAAREVKSKGTEGLHWETEEGFTVKPVYFQDDVSEETAKELPGKFPYTRGVKATMYTQRPWTIRQYAGFSTAKVCTCVCSLLSLSLPLSTALPLPVPSPCPSSQHARSRSLASVSSTSS